MLKIYDILLPTYVETVFPSVTETSETKRSHQRKQTSSARTRSSGEGGVRQRNASVLGGDFPKDSINLGRSPVPTQTPREVSGEERDTEVRGRDCPEGCRKE